MLKSDLIFFTKDGLTQLEEVLMSRHLNMYRNRKIPLTSPLPYEKYLGPNKKAKQSVYSSIIKPTLSQSELLRDKELTILTPSLQQYQEDLKKLPPNPKLT